ncbi:MAG: glycosyltransferase family 2 protein [Bacteroidaceae bacterium]|nr:glycosyltransferase family 2 protein [Bacteroidaceae bacterium]
MKKDISVVILNWNGSAMLQRFLPSVIRYSEEAEIIVADNGSTDHSIDILREKFPSVRILPFRENYGFAEGYNRAIQQIETPYVLLLNDDVEVTPHWLQPLLEFMNHHPEVAACQPKILSETQRELFEYAGACGGFIDHLGYPYCRGRIFNHVEKDRGQYDQVCPIFWATGAALLVRTDVFRKEGGLDKRFFAHMEEIDFCWRLRSRNYGIYCIPQSTVYHVGGGTLPKSHPRKTFLNFRNNLLMLYKNLPEERLNSTLRIRYFLDLVAALKMLLSGQVKESMAIVKALRTFFKIRHDFYRERKENLQKQQLKDIPEMRNESLLVAFYLKKKKKFEDWH